MQQTEHAPPCWTGLAELQPFLRSWLARRTRDASELEDILQETLLRAARYRGTLREGERLRPWVGRIARNVLTDHVRRSQRAGVTAGEDEILEHVEGRETSPGASGDDECMRLGLEDVAKDEVIGHMLLALGGLAEGDRRVLTSFYGGEGSCAATALECAIAQPLVKVRLFRARKRLARALRDRLAQSQERVRFARARVG